MSRTLSLSAVLALAALGACTPPEGNLALQPSLSQVRMGEVDLDALDAAYVLPDSLFIPGFTENTEDQPGYAPIPMRLTDEQMAKLANFDDDPAPLEKHASYAYTFGIGDLFDSNENRLEFDDVQQGAIGDCYLVAALSAVLHADVDGRIREGFVRPVRDAAGDPLHFAVRFYDYAGRPQDVEIDAELVRSASGNPTYARSMDSTRGDEEWGISLIEKAYAKWHGDYEKIGDGGSPGDVMQALTGSHASYRSVKNMTDSTVFSVVSQGMTDNRPMVAITYGEDDGVDYTGTSIYAWHAYTLMGAGTHEDGTRYVELRNPWGSTEPPGNGPDDGIFKLGLEEFRRLYVGISLGGRMVADTVAPAAVNDLSVTRAVDGGLVLGFTATGDDGQRGLAYRYDLRVSDAPITLDNFYEARRVAIADPQAPGARETVEITDLQNGATAYVAIRVEDESGNISPLGPITQGVPAAVSPVGDPNAVVFDFEGGLGDLLWDGLFHPSTVHTVNGGTAMYCGDAEKGTYDVGIATCALMLPGVDLSVHTDPRVTWAQRLTTEQSLAFDKAWVEVQGDSETTWTVVWERAEHQIGAHEFITVDLSAWAGQEVTVLFNFDSVEDSANDYAGWMIDDVTFHSAPE